jgi:1,4-alpha-glucan branching enzyme
MAIKNSEPRSEGKKSARASDIEGDGNFRNDLPDHDEPKHAAHNDNQFRKTLFHLKAPSAGSVKLVADFTDWEKYPLDMIRCEEGNWFAIVPLAPGNYSYRFIVDGQWFDDPQLPHRAPNPFGSANATVEIA